MCRFYLFPSLLAGFALYLPLFWFLFIGFIYQMNIKSQLLICILSILLFIFIMVFAFTVNAWLSGGSNKISDMYGMIYVIGIIPSLIIGLGYGIYIAFNLNKLHCKFYSI